VAHFFREKPGKILGVPFALIPLGQLFLSFILFLPAGLWLIQFDCLLTDTTTTQRFLNLVWILRFLMNFVWTLSPPTYNGGPAVG